VFFDSQHGFGQGLYAVRRVLRRVGTVAHADLLVSHVFGAVFAVDRQYDGRVGLGEECKWSSFPCVNVEFLDLGLVWRDDS
jgi:hypothetical protein